LYKIPNLESNEVLINLFSPKTSIFLQKRLPYSGNLNSETPGDSKNAFLYRGDVLELDDGQPIRFM